MDQEPTVNQAGAAQADEPRLVIYFLPLPDPIPIPHGTTLSFELSEKVPRLRGVARQPSSDVPPTPGSDVGQSFASIKFWQVRARTDYYLRQIEAAEKVISAVIGGESPEHQEPSPATITVAELVTHTSPLIGDSQHDPFTRCLTCLADVVDAYRVSENAKIAHISYERVGPLVISYQRSLTEPHEWWGPVAMQLDHTNVRVEDPEQLDSEKLNRLIQELGALRAGHPFSAWSELCRERDYAFHIEGDYRRTVIQAALAVEVLIYSVLSCLLWEGIFPDQPTDLELDAAAKILGKDASPMRAELGKRIGGDWGSTDSSSTLWQERGARLRNRVVHLGYRPSRHEAEQTIEAALTLDRTIRRRLAATASKHHRTAAMLLGTPGLQRYDAMTRRVRQLLDESSSEQNWAQSYRAWRVSVDGHASKQ